MRKKGFRKRILSCIIAAGLLASLTACGKEYAHHEKGVANTDTSQTDFSIMGGIGALSTPYSEKTVLNELQEETGIHINWNTISESIAEQVNIRIAGGSSLMRLLRWDLTILIFHATGMTVRLSICRLI